MSKYKLAISNSVLVAVQGAFNDENGNPTSFVANLVCKRLPEEELKVEMQGLSVNEAHKLMSKVVTGWRDQNLVLEEDGTPAAFTTEALEVLLSARGVGPLAFNAYLAESGAKAKN